jgi:glycosyltransferase involved in cell wall biosynthesis
VPVLSIITPTFRGARWLGETLDSVAALKTPHEHIVVDGGFDDGTVALLAARDDPALRWTSEPDRGQTHAVNKGLAQARGELMMWINGDDVAVPEGIDAAVAHFAANPDCMVVYGGLDFTDADGVVRREYRPTDWSFRRYLILGDYVQTPTIIWRRERYERAGPLDERWIDAADYDFFLRLMHGVRVDRLAGCHVRFRFHAASKTARDVWKQQDEALAIRLQWARTPLQRAAMVGFDRFKRRAVPILTRGRWPAPF